MSKVYIIEEKNTVQLLQKIHFCCLDKVPVIKLKQKGRGANREWKCRKHDVCLPCSGVDLIFEFSDFPCGPLA